MLMLEHTHRDTTHGTSRYDMKMGLLTTVEENGKTVMWLYRS